MSRPLAVVTGASGGIGAATARVLASQGFEVIAGARRIEPILELAEQIDGIGVALDVTSPESVEQLRAFVDEQGGRLSVLVNNAGGAHGFETIEQGRLEDWQTMYDVNVLGLVRVTQALLPALRASGDGLIVNVGSTAGRVAYEGGGGYTAAKHAVKVLTQTLRLELCGEPIRISEVAPGMVRTEGFSLTRYRGDHEAADRVYDGVAHPLTADDVAEAIGWIASRPSHVDIDEIVIKPRAQAAQHKIYRG